MKVHSVSHKSWLALDVHHCHITRIPMNPSINSVLKTKVDYTKQQWPKFNDLMKAFVTQQSGSGAGHNQRREVRTQGVVQELGR